MEYEQLGFFEKSENTKRNEFIANVFRQLGSTNITGADRQKEDFYATEPLATVLLCEKEKFTPTVWECCVGKGHIAEVLRQQGYEVVCSDIVDRGYPQTQIMDFLSAKTIGGGENRNDIVTNPPYKLATQFVKRAMDISAVGVKVAMFLKIQFLESQERWELFKEYPIKTVYVATKRLNCARDGKFDEFESSAVCYAWFVWEKGYKGDTIIKWINNE